MAKTAVSILQELMVQRKKLPNYVIENSDEKLGASFKCTIIIDEWCVCSYGPNKKEAKQNTAQKALQMLGITVQNHNIAPPSNRINVVTNPIPQRSGPFINYVGKLNEYASTHGTMYPTYVDNEITSLTGEFVSYCNFLNLKTAGRGAKKKDSKQDAARKMLDKLRTENISLTMVKTIEGLHIDKIKRIDGLSEILEKYENLSTKTEINIKIKSEPDLKIKVNTFEELKRELQKYDIKYSIETFQRNPYIMMLKIDGSTVTIMGKGDTRTQALNDLYETALEMFRHGFTW